MNTPKDTWSDYLHHIKKALFIPKVTPYHNIISTEFDKCRTIMSQKFFVKILSAHGMFHNDFPHTAMFFGPLLRN